MALLLCNLRYELKGGLPELNVLERERVLAIVAGSDLARRQVLAQLGTARSTYYRWLKEHSEGRLNDANRSTYTPWNRLRPEEEEIILAQARALPELSPRQLALRIIDVEGLYVSESTVRRILKRERLAGAGKVVGANVARGHQCKTKRPHELWVVDYAWLKMIGRRWYYLVTVMDDFSGFILAWKLYPEMTFQSLSDALQEAADLTGMNGVPVEDRIVLGDENTVSYLSGKLCEYLRQAGIKYIIVSPCDNHETNGEIVWDPGTVEGDINIATDEVPKALEEMVSLFVQYHNYECYHAVLGDVTPYDVYTGQHLQTLKRREQVKRRTLKARRQYNKTLREQGS
jgi:putative transposase